MANYETPKSYKYSVVASNNINMGQVGCAYTKAGSDAIKPPSGRAFVAIQCVEDTTFDNDGLVAEDANIYINTSGTIAHDLADGSETTTVGSGGVRITNSITFPQGTVIFGRWTEIDVNTGAVIAYIG